MSNFAEMSLNDQMEYATKVAKLLKDNNINTTVDIYREEVCQFTADGVKGRTILRVEKSLPSTQAEAAENFNAAFKKMDAPEGVSVKVNSAINVGDKFKTISKVTTIEDPSTEVSIEHIPGKVMFIDFWATWCPPCQRPMQHNQDMLEEHGEKWGDNVQIIGLSIDSDAPTVVNHVNNKGWTKVKHYHRAKSDCSDVYKVSGVPHVMILDKEGTIVFKGHPANRKDLVQDFNDLLEGKSLDGVEKPGEAAETDEATQDSARGVTADDIQKVMKQMDNFRDIGKELQTELKEEATGMPRNFCVMTNEAKLRMDELNPDGKWSQEFINHRVLVGPEAKCKACKDKIDEKLGKEGEEKEGWTFKIREQVHNM